MNFDHVGNSFSRCQDVIHSIVALTPAVADIRHMVTDGAPAAFMNTQHGFIAQLVKMETARMAFAIAIIHQDLQFIDIFFAVIHSKTQGVELRPQVASMLTFFGSFGDSFLFK